MVPAQSVVASPVAKPHTHTHKKEWGDNKEVNTQHKFLVMAENIVGCGRWITHHCHERADVLAEHDDHTWAYCKNCLKEICDKLVELGEDPFDRVRMLRVPELP